MNFKEVIEKYGYPFISKEVSECVDGARKYLKSIIGGGTGQYKYYHDKLCGQGKYAKSKWGGYDNKYRKLRGIGEYANKNGKDSRNANNGQSSEGEYP